MSIFSNRRWLVIPVTEIPNINFAQVVESSPESLRYSVDQTKTFVKYDVLIYYEPYTHTYFDPISQEEVTETIPAGVYGRPDIYSEEYPEYTHEEILTLLSGEEWTNPYPMTGSFSNS
jgi:hypothetical protein